MNNEKSVIEVSKQKGLVINKIRGTPYGVVICKGVDGSILWAKRFMNAAEMAAIVEAA